MLFLKKSSNQPDGWRKYFADILPYYATHVSKPAVATVGVLSFISSWNDLFATHGFDGFIKFSLQVAITTINTTQPVYINQVMASNDFNNPIDLGLYCRSKIH